MVAEFELTPEDLRAFNHFHYAHSPAMRRQYLRQWFTFPVVWLLLCVLIWYFADRTRGTPVRTFLDLWPLFAGVPFWLIYFPLAYRWKLRKIIAAMLAEGKSRSLFTRHRVSLSPDGVTDSTEFGQNSAKWGAVERVVGNDDYAFIYTNALAAAIVPRRAFASASDFEEFIKLASTHFAQYADVRK